MWTIVECALYPSACAILGYESPSARSAAAIFRRRASAWASRLMSPKMPDGRESFTASSNDDPTLASTAL